jgi:hypothetical protein
MRTELKFPAAIPVTNIIDLAQLAALIGSDGNFPLMLSTLENAVLRGELASLDDSYFRTCLFQGKLYRKEREHRGDMRVTSDAVSAWLTTQKIKLHADNLCRRWLETLLQDK